MAFPNLDTTLKLYKLSLWKSGEFMFIKMYLAHLYGNYKMLLKDRHSPDVYHGLDICYSTG